jgi:pimeloyl-ACP methyl ester carboxylesterase
MSRMTTSDGVKIYYEEVGSGEPIIFSHEFGDNYETWRPQLDYFGRRYRCVTYAARGFPPSDIPEEMDKYTQARVSADIGDLMDHLGMAQVHLVGVSMGSYAVLNYALANPDRVRSLVVGSGGHGSDLEHRAAVLQGIEARAAAFLEKGAEKMAVGLAEDTVRIPFKVKDPRGWKAFRSRLARHSTEGCARTLRGVFTDRPSVYSQKKQLEAFDLPVLLMFGDMDTPAIEPTLFMHQHMPRAGLLALPWSGHNLNVEEPLAFNRALEDFFHAVERDSWGYDLLAT